MAAAWWALRGAAGMTDRSSSLQRMVRRCGCWADAHEVQGVSEYQDGCGCAPKNCQSSSVSMKD